MRDLGAHLRFWPVVVGGLALDLWSKDWAFETLRQGGRQVLIPNVLEFFTTLNPGALFGIGAGHTEVFLIASVLALVLVLWMFAHSPRQQWVSQLALGAILAGALGNMYDRAFVSLIPLAGAGANGQVVRYFEGRPSLTSDMIALHEFPARDDVAPRLVPREVVEEWGPPRGYVRDFIKIPTRWFGGRELWPWVFNVADALLVVGVAALALRLLQERRARRRAARAALDATMEIT